MTTAVALIALFVICIGIAMLLANPSRLTNQIFSAGALLLTLELIAINQSLEAGIQFYTNEHRNPLFWVRISAALKELFPCILWALGDSLLNPNKSLFSITKRSTPWILISIALGIATLLPWYIPSTSLPNNIEKGPGYLLITIANFIILFILTLYFIIKSREQSGIRKIEVQFLAVNLSISTLVTTGLFSLGHILNVGLYKYISLCLVILAFSITAFGLTYYKVFNTKEILARIARHTLAAFSIYITTIPLADCLTTFMPKPIAFIFSLAITIPAISWVKYRILQQLGIKSTEKQTYIRTKAIDIARTAPNREVLVSHLEELLHQTYRPQYVRLDLGSNGAFDCNDMALEKSNPGYDSLCEIGWATPESLNRRRPTTGIASLQEAMAKSNLGLLITAPRNSPEPSLLVAMGVKDDRTPYTYPEIVHIQEISELIDNLLTRSQLTAQKELQARIEILALMSRGLAHDLKNLITPVSLFLNSYPKTIGPAAMQDPGFLAAQQSMRVISDYVEEAHFFSRELVPRLESVNPRILVDEVLSSLRNKADRESVFVAAGQICPDSISVDRVLLQRLISNLLDNAIDASEPGGRVTIHGGSTSEGQYRFSVVDSGTGIPPGILPRIFDPYFTTKDLGTKARGFGLGLAICQRIVEIHGGNIGVRTSVGAGTTFEVTLPRRNDLPTAPADPQSDFPAECNLPAFG